MTLKDHISNYIAKQNGVFAEEINEMDEQEILIRAGVPAQMIGLIVLRISLTSQIITESQWWTAENDTRANESLAQKIDEVNRQIIDIADNVNLANETRTQLDIAHR